MKQSLFLVGLIATCANASMTCGDIKAIWKDNSCCSSDPTKTTCLNAITETDFVRLKNPTSVFETLTCDGDAKVTGDLQLCGGILQCQEGRRLGGGKPQKLNIFAKIKELEGRIETLEAKLNV